MGKVEKELRVSKIKTGTVIDHITSGKALAVLRILNITGQTGAIISILMNVPSKMHGKKDVIKVENRKLTEEEVNKIALAAPNATINIIKDFKVTEKKSVELPEFVEGIIKCANPGCITNTSEPAIPRFRVVSKTPVNLRCVYCERITGEKELLSQF
ncbi:Aspartate carbamoyltransferase regulatory chain [subsurface metagenome]